MVESLLVLSNGRKKEQRVSEPSSPTKSPCAFCVWTQQLARMETSQAFKSQADKLGPGKSSDEKRVRCTGEEVNSAKCKFWSKEPATLYRWRQWIMLTVVC